MGEFVLGALAVFVLALVFVPMIVKRARRAQHLADLELAAARRDVELAAEAVAQESVRQEAAKQDRASADEAMGLPGGMWGCPRCNAINDSEDRRCSSCGSSR